MTKKILITGCNGMLGNDLVNTLVCNSNYNLFGIDRLCNPHSSKNINQVFFDITDSSLLKKTVNNINPDIIIHLAAIVNLNICEDNFLMAKSLHADTTRNLANHGYRIIYISTDSIFNGEQGNYTEKCIPDPLNNYAISKLMGEYAVRANNKNHLIIRTNIFGFNNPLKGSLAEWALSSLNKGEAISGFTNVMFNAIYTKQLAQIISKLIMTDLHGIINIASTTAISKYDFLLDIAETAGYPKSIVKKAEMANNSKIMRPLNTSLCVDYAKTLVKLPTIESGIKDLVTDFKKEYNNE